MKSTCSVHIDLLSLRYMFLLFLLNSIETRKRVAYTYYDYYNNYFEWSGIFPQLVPFEDIKPILEIVQDKCIIYSLGSSDSQKDFAKYTHGQTRCDAFNLPKNNLQAQHKCTNCSMKFLSRDGEFEYRGFLAKDEFKKQMNTINTRDFLNEHLGITTKVVQLWNPLCLVDFRQKNNVPPDQNLTDFCIQQFKEVSEHEAIRRCFIPSDCHPLQVEFWSPGNVQGIYTIFSVNKDYWSPSEVSDPNSRLAIAPAEILWAENVHFRTVEDHLICSFGTGDMGDIPLCSVITFCYRTRPHFSNTMHCTTFRTPCVIPEADSSIHLPDTCLTLPITNELNQLCPSKDLLTSLRKAHKTFHLNIYVVCIIFAISIAISICIVCMASQNKYIHKCVHPSEAIVVEETEETSVDNEPSHVS